MKRTGILGAAAAMVLFAAAWLAPISSAKPPATPPPPPARTFSYTDANGQPYGGLRDSYTGLVWGFWSRVHSPNYSYQWTGAVKLIVEGYDSYNEFSNTYYGRSDGDWRLPTKDELVEVGQTGIMAALDSSLEPGVQLYPAGFAANGWSSTTDAPRKHAWYVYLLSGNSELRNMMSGGYYIPVRGPVPE